VKLTLPYPPSANAYWRAVNGRVLKSEEARRYQNGVRMRWLTTKPPEAPLKPPGGPVVVSVVVFRPQRRGDLDNVLKVLLDSLKGIAFEDDSQVVELHALRFDDKANPRAEVTIEALPP
jgi:crossover junction endodeoxyribonuclease RusA